METLEVRLTRVDNVRTRNSVIGQQPRGRHQAMRASGVDRTITTGQVVMPSVVDMLLDAAAPKIGVAGRWVASAASIGSALSVNRWAAAWARGCELAVIVAARRPVWHPNRRALTGTGVGHVPPCPT
jgi:hypothetical protein